MRCSQSRALTWVGPSAEGTTDRPYKLWRDLHLVGCWLSSAHCTAECPPNPKAPPNKYAATSACDNGAYQYNTHIGTCHKHLVGPFFQAAGIFVWFRAMKRKDYQLFRARPPPEFKFMPELVAPKFNGQANSIVISNLASRNCDKNEVCGNF